MTERVNLFWRSLRFQTIFFLPSAWLRLSNAGPWWLFFRFASLQKFSLGTPKKRKPKDSFTFCHFRWPSSFGSLFLSLFLVFIFLQIRSFVYFLLVSFLSYFPFCMHFFIVFERSRDHSFEGSGRSWINCTALISKFIFPWIKCKNEKVLRPFPEAQLQTVDNWKNKEKKNHLEFPI